jgi:hypothetical protein
MTRKNILRLICALTLVFSWSILSAEPGSMVDESAQPATENTDSQPTESTQPAETTDAPSSRPASECSADLRSDSPSDQIRGAQCAAMKKDQKAVPDLIQVLKNQDQADVLNEVLIALAVIGETGDSTAALIAKAGDNSLKPADHYVVIATLAALRTDEKKAEILSILTSVEESASDELLKHLAGKLKTLIGG